MPIVIVKMARGRSIEQKRILVKAITDAIVETLNVEPEWVTVLIEEFERENWATGGQLHIDKFGRGFGKVNKDYRLQK
jgi:4-oxalocrotonate tautomerase